MNDETISAMSKVKKLLALAAKGSGATEDERMTAMKMAMALMAKHGIEQSMLADAKQVKAIYGMRKTAAMKIHQVNLATAAGALYGCEVVFWNRGKNGFRYIGRPDNIDAAEMTLLWLMQQVDELYKLMRPKGLGEGERQKFYHTFKRACSETVWVRAREYVDKPELIAVEVGKNALVVKDYFDQLKMENRTMMADQKFGSMRIAAARSGLGTSLGRQAGNKVQLHRQVR